MNLLRRAPTHVSIHDVSPASARELEEALSMCDEVGAKPALLVVPNFHGRWPLDRYPSFVERLRELEAAGHELLLHGFFHLADETRGARGFFNQRLMSAGEAEFAALDHDTAAKRLDDGLEVLRALGLTAYGFVPPAWQMLRWLLPLLAERGVRYTEDHLHVYDPVSRMRRASLVLNFASRTPARLWSSAAFVRLALPARSFLPTRIAIHPNDLHHKVLRRETRRVLRLSRGTLTATTRDLV